MTHTLISPARLRPRFAALAVAAAVLGLSACGGSDTVELSDAYVSIQLGMTYSLVRTIVGQEPASALPEDGTDILYRWENNKGTTLYSQLLVQVNPTKGVVAKVINSPNLNESQTRDGISGGDTTPSAPTTPAAPNTPTTSTAPIQPVKPDPIQPLSTALPLLASDLRAMTS